ncbi:hypothetical protein F5884DRAFT_750438 [Xylogone sp. PMI_703]|nr:hypothetical protein F5884DRAFT_750438 [Xylogone sp. PMI_703]
MLAMIRPVIYIALEIIPALAALPENEADEGYASYSTLYPRPIDSINSRSAYNGMNPMYFVATSLIAFLETTSRNLSSADFTGPNSIIRYDTNAHKISWISDLVSIHNEILHRTGN